eukprot:1156888-Pelagomonas_calceolata.AAC.2
MHHLNCAQFESALESALEGARQASQHAEKTSSNVQELQLIVRQTDKKVCVCVRARAKVCVWVWVCVGVGVGVWVCGCVGVNGHLVEWDFNAACDSSKNMKCTKVIS